MILILSILTISDVTAQPATDFAVNSTCTLSDGSSAPADMCQFPKLKTAKCEAGSYCQSPVGDNPKPCSPGFYCPENAYNPIWCPESFNCSKDARNISLCPKNFYCPAGTVDPLKCSFLAYCPEGTNKSPKLGLFLVMAVLFLIPYLLLKWNEASHRARKLKDSYEFDSINNESSFLELDQPALSRLEKTFDIQFTDLTFTLPSGVTIMSEVSGMLFSGRTTAIMGPSGVGKTTLLTLLTGKIKRTRGSVRINGKLDELQNYRKLVGYVPQEDIMLRELSVRDVLVHSARMRLPSNWEYKQIKSKVLEIISFLRLSHVIDSIIGNAEERGISGGQRKRVNIGMELVAEPSILFLDEPTSGLDSSTSYEVCVKLKEIAKKKGLTVAAVIHSPSPAIFRQFDDLLLLGKGGRVVYMGPRENSAAYFASIGFTCPNDECPSDFFMNVVSGKVKSAMDPDFKLTDLFEYWKMASNGEPILPVSHIKSSEMNHQSEQSNNCCININLSNGGNCNPGSPKKMILVDSFKSNLKTKFGKISEYLKDLIQDFTAFLVGLVRWISRSPDPVRNNCPLYLQLWLLMKRASMQMNRTFRFAIFDIILQFGCGVLISISIQNFSYLGKFPKEVCELQTLSLKSMCEFPVDSINTAGMFIVLGIFFSGIAAGTSTFGRERLVFWRDTAAGMSAIPYYIGKFIMDLPRVIVAAAVYSSGIVLFYPLKGDFWSFLNMVIVMYFNAFSIGYFISIVLPPGKSALVVPLAVIIWGFVLNGVNPNLGDVSKSPLNNFSLLWDLSAPRWGIEFFWYISESLKYFRILEVGGTAFSEAVQKEWDSLQDKGEFSHSYIWTNQTKDITQCINLAVMWNVFAFFSLKLFYRDKQK